MSCGELSPQLRPDPSAAASPSVAWGTAGVAYFLLRDGTLRADPAALAAASQTAALATRQAEDPDASQWRAVAPETPDMAKSLYYHQPGAWCVRAVVAAGTDDVTLAREAVERFAGFARDPTDEHPADATLGRPSLLLGCACLIESVEDPAAAGIARDTGERLAEQINDLVAECADRDPEEGELLGAAHGLAGLAHVLLRWSQATEVQPSPGALRLVERLATLRRRSGLWPIRAGSREVWRGWCNGSAGFAQLWALAFELTGESAFLEFAERTAADAVAGDEPESPTLCCGWGGEAYAALSLYRVTDDSAWLDAARRVAAKAASRPVAEFADADGPLSGEHGLLKGEPGVALLLAELEQPDRAGMPLWEAVR